MDPQQQPQPPYGQSYPPADNNPYQFIMEPPKKQKPSSGLAGNPFIVKLLFIVGSAIVVLIVGAIIINTMFAPKTNVADIVAITQAEQEIIRIASQGPSAAEVSTRDAAISTQLAVTTQQQIWLNYLAQHKRKVPLKELNLKKNTTTDSQLTQAKATSTFDGTYKTVLRNQLEAYIILLKDASDKAGDANEKTVLTNQYNQTQLLIQQFPEQ
jgi:hypothetical protein